MEENFTAGKGVVLMLVLWVAALMPLLAPNVQAPLTWTRHTVDSSAADVGEWTSIALDSLGYPHISYYDDTNGNLKYARWTGSSWSIEVVDSSGWVDGHTSIAVDSWDNPHISYRGDGSLKYARKTGASWSIETLDAGDKGGFTSIALDSYDRPHISYKDYLGDNLKYARWTGYDWSIKVVFWGGHVGYYSSIALDYNDHPHISHYQWAPLTEGLLYARWTGTEWMGETVDYSVGEWTSLALDSTDNPHISYYDYDSDLDQELRYAKKTGAWSVETVDSAGDVGGYTSIAVDCWDRPHISYHDYSNGHLKYARKTGASWSTEIVDSTAWVGEYTSIAVDSDGTIHISYYDYTNKNLKYATATAPTPPDHDEYFSSAAYTPLDRDGDGKNDAVEVKMNVDTTHTGTLTVQAFALLKDPTGNYVNLNKTRWSITDAATEYGYIHLYVPRGSPEGWYDVDLVLYDNCENWEDLREDSAVAYLYPPAPLTLHDVKTWYWVDWTGILSVACGDVDGDGQNEIVTGGYYNDGTRYRAQLCVWSGSLALEGVKTWYWTDDTWINSVAIGDVDGDGQNEIVTSGRYWDGTRGVAQLCVWTGATLALEDVKTWYWTGETVITSVVCGDADGDVATEIVTGGYYSDGTHHRAQLCVWDGSLSLEDVTTWYWMDGTNVYSVAVGDVDKDGAVEIVTGGYYSDHMSSVAQLCVWDGSSLALEGVKTWCWGTETFIRSVAVGDVDGDGEMEIVTGGEHNLGWHDNAQLCVWEGSTLALEGEKTWYWTDETWINSVAVGDVDGDVATEIVTGGCYYDGTDDRAQLCVWEGSTLIMEDVETWHWTSHTEIRSVAVGDVDGDGSVEIVTGGNHYDLTRWVAQLCVWEFT